MIGKFGSKFQRIVMNQALSFSLAKRARQGVNISTVFYCSEPFPQRRRFNTQKTLFRSFQSFNNPISPTENFKSFPLKSQRINHEFGNHSIKNKGFLQIVKRALLNIIKFYYYIVGGLFVLSSFIILTSDSYQDYIGANEYSKIPEDSNIKYIKLWGVFGLYASLGLVFWPIYKLSKSYNNLYYGTKGKPEKLRRKNE